MKWVIAAVGLAACGGVNDPKTVDAKMADAPKQVDAAPDADTRRCDPTKPFAAPVGVDGINTGSYEGWPTLSSDELTMYFMSNRGGAGSTGAIDVFVATRPSITAAFGTPAAVANVNTTGDDECPTVTADGLFLYVDRNAGSASTYWDIYLAQRANTTVDFGTPMLVPSLNQTANGKEDDNQFILPNNSAMYFISDRGISRDIYRAARNVGGTFDTPVAVLPLPNSNENSAAVTNDELTMYFSTDATPTLGLQDVWMSKRTTTADGWGTPVHVDELSSPQVEYVNWVSPDGCAVYMQQVVNGSNDIVVARKPL
jgi:hypothetical protein